MTLEKTLDEKLADIKMVGNSSQWFSGVEVKLVQRNHFLQLAEVEVYGHPKLGKTLVLWHLYRFLWSYLAPPSDSYSVFEHALIIHHTPSMLILQVFCVIMSNNPTASYLGPAV